MKTSGGSGISLLDTDVADSPRCPHGPTLLFSDVTTKEQYYRCSSCRDRKDCHFSMTVEEWIQMQTKPKLMDKYRQRLDRLAEDNARKYDYVKRRKRMSGEMHFCRNCSLIISSMDSLSDHKTHQVMSGITVGQMRKPTKLLNSLTDNRFCAQYLFSKQTIDFLMNEILIKNSFKRVVNICCPTLHEYIDCHKNKLQMKSILLDIDDRFKQFYCRKKYLKYNLFNNYFFGGDDDETIFERFIADSPKESIVLIIDPPFGGLIQPIGQTIIKINYIWRKCHQIFNESQSLPILLFFPYFNENRIITTIPTLSMSDFMVDYQNHRKFKSSANSGGRKFGSPVRIFTNIKLSAIVLPESDGYYCCQYCHKYVSKNNKHCFECNDCTARDGKPYNHCYICKRCVKNTWKHCKRCGYCHLSQSCPTKSSEDNSDIVINTKKTKK